MSDDDKLKSITGSGYKARGAARDLEPPTKDPSPSAAAQAKSETSASESKGSKASEDPRPPE